ncbi:phage tail family protein [Streptomyces sp. LP11]|uniref:Phage tail family protein n=1 Tax=Streptomyces pyxinicus TaxID=2970331 RepID=A0ABT2AXW0_9ACTN|nr:phage tail family protein [Streptomyces sp. LP11]MCS0601097.1 phage tail family protein [Streptomyces sp. LP11]
MPKLILSSGTDTLNLNEIADKGLGYQAKSGATGFGLPPVTVQWLEGAGDGSVYRRKRVQSRDIDLALEILARDRTDLQARLSRLALAVSDRCVLTLQNDDGTRWSLVVYRTGGGEFTYGVETIGEREFETVITFRAPDPYWTSSVTETRRITGATSSPFLSTLGNLKVSASQAIGTIELNNSGDAEAYPVWKITGPGRTFTAVSPTGERLKWNGKLAAGESLTIDTKAGTVVDQDGTNRYNELDAAPRFWTVKPGLSTAEASLLDISKASAIVCSWQPRKWMVV